MEHQEKDRQAQDRRSLARLLVLGVVATLIGAALIAAFSGVWSFAFPSDEPTPADQRAEVQDLGEQMHGRFDDVDESIAEILDALEDTGGRMAEEDDGGEADSGGAVAIDMFSRHRGGR